jgi:hypothetical protein
LPGGLGPDEVRQIADLLDKLNDNLIKDSVYIEPFNNDGSTEDVEIGDVSIELRRTSLGSVIGYAILDDGWIGFRPKT